MGLYPQLVISQVVMFTVVETGIQNTIFRGEVVEYLVVLLDQNISNLDSLLAKI